MREARRTFTLVTLIGTKGDVSKTSVRLDRVSRVMLYRGLGCPLTGDPRTRGTQVTRFPIPSRRARPIASFPADRVCAKQGCTTILSTYNPDPRCAAHAGYATTVAGHGNAK